MGSVETKKRSDQVSSVWANEPRIFHLGVKERESYPIRCFLTQISQIFVIVQNFGGMSWTNLTSC